MGISVRVLGPFVLEVEARQFPVSSRRVRALLAALALRAGNVVSMASLIDRVWDGQLPARPRSSLQTLVNRLRMLIGQDLVVTGPEGYLLDLAPAAVDALRFQQLLDSARDAAPEPARQAIGEALGLWRGEPLLDAGSTLLAQDYGPSLHERYLTALECRSDLDLRLGRPAGELVAELRELAVRYPLRESLWARLITVLCEASRPAEALEAYETIRTRLVEELGTDPSAELQQQYLRLLAAEPITGPEATEEPDPVPVPRQLPADVTPFVGRQDELAWLDGLLTAVERGDGGAYPWVVHGPGGAGKTALSTHWAHRHAARFPDGQLHVDLRGFGPDEMVPPSAALDALLRAMGVPANRIPPTVDERAAMWRDAVADRRMLLLFDNARDEAHVRPLLPGGRPQVLITSRNLLSGLAIRHGARQLAVDELTDDDAYALLRDIVRAARARAGKDDLEALAAAGGRLPLAVRIVGELACRYADTPLAELVAALNGTRQRLAVLSSTDDPFSNMRAVLDWSYRSLAPPTAKLFRYLALHPGAAMTAPEVAALAGVTTDEAGSLLGRLSAVHLVESPRLNLYMMHDLLRAYALEQLDRHETAADRSAAVARLLDWYRHTVYRARNAAVLGTPEPELAGGDPPVPLPEFEDGTAALRWYDATRPALVAAVRLGHQQGQHDAVWRLGRLLRDFFEVRGHLDDWVTVGHLAVHSARELDDPLALYQANLLLGSGCCYQPDPSTAEAPLREALRYAEQAEDFARTSAVLRTMAMAAVRLGDNDRSIRLQQEAVAAAERDGDPLALAHALLGLGARQIDTGQYAPGVDTTHRALELYRSLGAGHHQALALGNLAEGYEGMGAFDRARACSLEAVATSRTVGSGKPTVNMLITLGRIQVALNRPNMARLTWRQALVRMRPERDYRIPQVETMLALLDRPHSLPSTPHRG
jgi:DNA-binding SARP family transcriptional activator/tetratricopeptide (TPR) repeat protein